MLIIYTNRQLIVLDFVGKKFLRQVEQFIIVLIHNHMIALEAVDYAASGINNKHSYLGFFTTISACSAQQMVCRLSQMIVYSPIQLYAAIAKHFYRNWQ